MRAIVRGHKVRQNVPTGAAHELRKEGVAGEIKVPTSDDIWHLSIEDLLAPATEPARTAGQGPFVLNLRTSTATIGSPPKGLLPFDRLHVYQLMRSHDGQPQFQLRLGIIESELEADTLLSMVREHYPGAIKERAEDDDKAAIARAACPAEPAKPARVVTEAKAPVVQVPKKVAPPTARQAAPKPAEHGRLDIDELLAADDDKGAVARAACPAEPAKPARAVAEAKAPVVQEPKKVAPPAARQATLPAARQATRPAARPAAPKPAARPAAPKPAEHSQWDIDELLPELAAVRPPGGEAKPPTCTASKGEGKPPKVSTPRSAKAQVPHSAAAPRARPGAQSRPTPALEKTRQSQASRAVTKTPPVERQEPLSLAPDRVLTEPREHVNPARPVTKPAQLPVDVAYDATRAERAPTSAFVQEIESDSNAITDQVEVLTLRIERQIGAATKAPLPPASASGSESSIEHKPLDVPEVANARPAPDSRRLNPAAPGEPKPLISADAPAAAAHANLPVASGTSANAPQSDVNASVAAAPPAASRELIAPEPVSPIPPPRAAQSASAPAGAPVLDGSETVPTLAPLELADGEASCWFAIQLMLSEEPIDTEQVPSLGIFAEYRLYSVTGLEQDRVRHVLRVGFFSSELAAQAVAGYLVGYFDSPVVKRVSNAERERFADTGVAARKAVGASDVHAVIELATPAPVPRCRIDAAPSDSSKRAALEATSLWSRLLAPRTR